MDTLVSTNQIKSKLNLGDGATILEGDSKAETPVDISKAKNGISKKYATITFDDSGGTSVSGITLEPISPTVAVGETLFFLAAVEGGGKADKSVVWSLSGNLSSGTTLDGDGLLTAAVGEKGVTCRSEAVPAGGPCDPALLEAFKPIDAGVQKWLDVVVGHLDRPYLPADPLTMAAEGSDLADFFNRVQFEASGAEISVSSLANDAAGLPPVVRRRDVLTAYPYTNTLLVLRVTGRALRQAIERTAEYFALDEAGELQVSDRFLKPKVEHYNYDYYAGVEYTIDVRRPEGERVTALTFRGEPVAEDREFTVCLSSYRASGAGGYPWYIGCPVEREINVEMTDLILEFFEKHPQGADLGKRGLRLLGAAQ